MASEEYIHKILTIKCCIESATFKKNEVNIGLSSTTDWDKKLKLLLSKITTKKFKFLADMDDSEWTIQINNKIIDKTDGDEFRQILSSIAPIAVVEIVTTKIDDNCYIIAVHYENKQFNHKIFTDKDDWDDETLDELKSAIRKQFNLDSEFLLYEDVSGDKIFIDDMDDITAAIDDNEVYEDSDDDSHQVLHLFVDVPVKMINHFKIIYTNTKSFEWIPPNTSVDDEKEWDDNHTTLLNEIFKTYNINMDDIQLQQSQNGAECDVDCGDDLLSIWKELVEDKDRYVAEIKLDAETNDIYEIKEPESEREGYTPFSKDENHTLYQNNTQTKGQNYENIQQNSQQPVSFQKPLESIESKDNSVNLSYNHDQSGNITDEPQENKKIVIESMNVEDTMDGLLDKDNVPMEDNKDNFEESKIENKDVNPNPNPNPNPTDETYINVASPENILKKDEINNSITDIKSDQDVENELKVIEPGNNSQVGAVKKISNSITDDSKEENIDIKDLPKHNIDMNKTEKIADQNENITEKQNKNVNGNEKIGDDDQESNFQKPEEFKLQNDIEKNDKVTSAESDVDIDDETNNLINDMSQTEINTLKSTLEDDHKYDIEPHENEKQIDALKNVEKLNVDQLLNQIDLESSNIVNKLTQLGNIVGSLGNDRKQRIYSLLKGILKGAENGGSKATAQFEKLLREMNKNESQDYVKCAVVLMSLLGYNVNAMDHSFAVSGEPNQMVLTQIKSNFHHLSNAMQKPVVNVYQQLEIQVPSKGTTKFHKSGILDDQFITFRLPQIVLENQNSTLVNKNVLDPSDFERFVNFLVPNSSKDLCKQIYFDKLEQLEV
eukprot:435733_1